MSGRPIGESAVHQIQILGYLHKKDFTQQQLSDLTGLDISTISKHLKTLEQNKLIKKYRADISKYKIDFTNANVNYFEQIGRGLIDHSAHKMKQMIVNEKASRKKTKKVLDNIIGQIEEYRNYVFYHGSEITLLHKSVSDEDLMKYARQLRITKYLGRNGIKRTQSKILNIRYTLN